MSSDYGPMMGSELYEKGKREAAQHYIECTRCPAVVMNTVNAIAYHIESQHRGFRA